MNQTFKPQYKPLYSQIREVIHQRIVNSIYPVNCDLPSEKQLANEFGVSISTIRQAVGLLVDDGLLVRQQGKGTFVSQNPLTIRFLGWIGEFHEGNKVMREIINIFERKNPNLRVEYIVTNYDNLKKEYLQRVQRGEAPDVVQIVSHWTSSLASMGLLEPLTEMLPAPNLAGRFSDKDLQGGMYHGKLFSVAWGICPMCLIYNRELVGKSGVKLPERLTPEAFLAICRQIGRVLKGQDVYSYGFCSDANVFLHTYNFLLAFNADIINDNNQIVIDSPEAAQAYRWLNSMTSSGNVVWKEDIWELRRLFAEGKLAFLQDGPWIRGIIKDLRDDDKDFDASYGVMQNPAVPNSSYSSWNYNHAVAISSMSNQKEIAAKFIDSLTSDPDICELYFHEIGLLPPMQQMLQSPSYSGHVYYREFIKQLQNARMLKADNPLIDKVIDFCADASRNILLKNKDIEPELSEKAYYLRMLYS